MNSCLMFNDRYAAVKSLEDRFRNGVIAEVGTQQGHFARFLQDCFSPSELHLFDIDFRPLDQSQAISDERNVKRHLGDSSGNLAKFTDEYFDLIYLDADHTYLGVKRDVSLARSKVKRGGIIVFNDYVLWYINEFSMYGVPRACNELSIEFGFKWVYLAMHPMLHLDVALERP